MKASYNSQMCMKENTYSIQFATDNYQLYKAVEDACREAIDFCDTYNSYLMKGVDIYGRYYWNEMGQK